MSNFSSSSPMNHGPTDRCHLIGNSPAALQLIDLAQRVACSSAPALLVGPAGTEFNLVAEFIHRHSSQASLPMVRQRCVSWQDLVDPLGMVGAGTLFVDGIEHASLPVQLRLLHELEQAQLMRLRADEATIQTPRIIASTTVALTELVASGLFVDDLYWQLSPVTITVPSLSERNTDIVEIAQMLLAQIVAIHRPAIQPVLTAEAIQQLQAYSWPGNFRELHSTLQRAVLLTTKPELSFDFSPTGSADQQWSVRQENNLTAAATVARPPLGFADLVQAVVQHGIIEADSGHKELHQYIVDQVEIALISTILRECDNVQTKAAIRLGINRNTLHKKLKDFGLEPAS